MDMNTGRIAIGKKKCQGSINIKGVKILSKVLAQSVSITYFFAA